MIHQGKVQRQLAVSRCQRLICKHPSRHSDLLKYPPPRKDQTEAVQCHLPHHLLPSLIGGQGLSIPELDSSQATAFLFAGRNLSNTRRRRARSIRLLPPRWRAHASSSRPRGTQGEWAAE